MSHHKFASLALITTGVMTLTAVCVPFADAARTSMASHASAIPSATLLAPSPDVETMSQDIWQNSTALALGEVERRTDRREAFLNALLVPSFRVGATMWSLLPSAVGRVDTVQGGSLVQGRTALSVGQGSVSSLTATWAPDDTTASVHIESRGLTHLSVQRANEDAVTSVVADGKWERALLGWWYRYPDGSYPRNQAVTIDGKVYRFDSSGYMETGWAYDGRSWYYHSSSGVMITGWVNVEGSWYYLRPGTGTMVKGWFQDGSSWYYLSTFSGKMVTGWLRTADGWYYLRPGSGAMVTGWFQIGWQWYQFDGSGKWIS